MIALTIAGRELRAAFHTPIGWLVLAAFLFLNGVFLTMWVGWYVETSYSFAAGPYGGTTLNFAEHLFAPFFSNVAVILVFTAPAISMRLFAEERRNHTLELLMTSPITTFDIVAGKFLGALGFAVLLLASTLLGPVFIWFNAPIDWGSLAAAYLSLTLLAGAVLAIGTVFSAMTTSQIIAWFLTMAVAIVLYVAGTVGGPGSVLEQIGLLSHIDEMLVGGLRLSDLVYFAGMIGVPLFAAHQRIEAFRWS